MLTHHHKSVCLSIISTDLPICSEINTIATLYQKDQEQFHLLLTEPVICDRAPVLGNQEITTASVITTPRLLWLEFSPYRVNLTMQGNGGFSYRHLWERGVYGLSRYWLHNDASGLNHHFRTRNFTRHLSLTGNPMPNYLRLEYELWGETLPLGRYVLNLEIRH